MKIRTTIFIVTLLLLSGCKSAEVATFREADDPIALTAEQLQQWDNVKGGVNAQWASADYLYSRSVVPENLSQTLSVAGWQGEKVSAQLLVWSAEDLDGVRCEISDFRSDNASLRSDIATPHFVRYTLADVPDKSCLCGRANGHPAMLQADMLDNLERFDIAERTVRPVWISIEVPQDAVAGVYKAKVKISHSGFGSVTLPLQLEVIAERLSEPSEWDFHLDLWQHPSSVARVEGVEMWSDEHFEAMRPVMQMLADAGQKVITATLNRDPWRYQCFDDYEPMIYWTLNDNDVWSYDYTIFDAVVKLLLRSPGYRARKGNARNAKLGEPGCEEDTVAGAVLIHMGKKPGESGLDPVFMLAAVLEWAGIATNGRGYIALTADYRSML